ncbi:MAG: serine/threonine protein kinase, partial [Myxococcales bacterium]|nr:serine/threonine protein kinase [Myxococcales bacterium]
MKRKAGDTIADKYRLLHPLRQGGMGAVWVALHVDLEIEVAIKFIDSELDEDPVLRSRFKREAKAAASLS